MIETSSKSILIGIFGFKLPAHRKGFPAKISFFLIAPDPRLRRRDLQDVLLQVIFIWGSSNTKTLFYHHDSRYSDYIHDMHVRDIP